MIKNISVALLGFCVSLISCSSADKQEISDQTLPQKSSVELKEVARVSNINDEIYFSSFRKLLVTSKGDAIINDFRQQHFFILTKREILSIKLAKKVPDRMSSGILEI